MKKADIQIVPVAELSPHPENPRKGDLSTIIESIKANGWYGALVAQRSTRFVLAGNHRLFAAQALDMQQVPVYWVDVDDATARRIMLADNRAADLATYDDQALADLLAQVQNADGGLAGSGFDDGDLEALMHGLVEVQPSHQGLRPDVLTGDDAAASIEAKGIRSIIIPLEMEDYNFAVARLTELRKQHGADTNAEVFLKLLAG